MKWCNFVKSIKEGKNIYYYISDERIKEFIQLGQSIAEGSINDICTCEVIMSEQNKLKEKNIDYGKRNFE
ncbi:helix-turn-helix domain-containing protein [Clostridium homopropionicum]|uniref:helix-turn-helix domain-containing protein n=1 Tax=Clostridium homopropionicum TaxID=36844 RepID=UPI001FA7B41C|nr:helix-turn-helix domain-containing protein [Clostridium homopropionicum]